MYFVLSNRARRYVSFLPHSLSLWCIVIITRAISATVGVVAAPLPECTISVERDA